MPTPWDERARAKRDSILAAVPPRFVHPELAFSETDPASVMHVPATVLSADERAITEQPVADLVADLAAGRRTAEAVLDAFTHRAVVAHQLVHCCLAFPYPAALARARALDAARARGDTPLGPLHGLPVSLKDQCRVAGTDTTCGFVAHVGEVDADNAVLVDLLLDAGAVPFCKTSLSVGCMWGETVNNNPYNRAFSCGGSSGGEGALLALRGSPLGVGTDLGGSIRSPAAYQGLFGLRPSAGRFPYAGLRNSMDGQEIVPSVVGPMARSVDALRLFARAVVAAAPWTRDPACVPVPWASSSGGGGGNARPLTVGLLDWDGAVLPQPPVRRALREAAAALRAAGHRVVPLAPAQLVDHQQGLALALRVFAADNNADVAAAAARSGEPPLAQISERRPDGTTASSSPRADDPVARAAGEVRRDGTAPLSLAAYWALAVEVRAFRAAVLRRWQAAGLDAYLAPVNPSVCPRHGDYARVRHLAYTAAVNVADLPACTVPVTRVDPAADPADPRPDADAHGRPLPPPTGALDAAVRARYDPRVYAGLPVALQLVGPRFGEEALLDMVGELDRLLRGE